MTIVSSIITFFIVREIVLYLYLWEDFSSSMIPGWHTTIYTNNTPKTILTIIFLGKVLIVVAIYKLVCRLVKMGWKKIIRE